MTLPDSARMRPGHIGMMHEGYLTGVLTFVSRGDKLAPAVLADIEQIRSVSEELLKPDQIVRPISDPIPYQTGFEVMLRNLGTTAALLAQFGIQGVNRGNDQLQNPGDLR